MLELVVRAGKPIWGGHKVRRILPFPKHPMVGRGRVVAGEAAAVSI
jgi:hypothetical protein